MAPLLRRLGNHPGGWWVGPLVVGRVGGWVRWLIEFVGFMDGFTFLFLCVGWRVGMFFRHTVPEVC